jgi:hypothetical protein
MKKALKTAVFALCMAVFAQGATVPTQDMTNFSLGAEYYGSLNGHVAMYDFDKSALAAHILRLHYAPLPFVRFSAGAGGAHQYGDNLDGVKVGLAATGGVGLYLPKLLDFLSLTGGYDGYYLKASQEDKGYLTLRENDEPDGELMAYEYLSLTGKTTGYLHVPYLGVVFHLGRFVDIEAGGLYRYFEVDKEIRRIERSDNYDVRSDSAYGRKGAVSTQGRIYGTLTLHERESGAYLTGGASYAPVVDENAKGKGQLVRFTAHAQIGLIMKDPRGSFSKKPKSEYSDTYIDLKARQDGMADALQRDIDRDKARNVEEGRDENDFSEEETVE